MEAELLKIMEEILERDLDAAELDTPFLQQEGWSSLLHLIFISRVEEIFSIDVPMEAIPDIKTPRDLLEYFRHEGQDR